MSHAIDPELFHAHEHALDDKICPKCGAQNNGHLQLKYGKHGAFLGCDQYPECDFIQPLHQNDGHIVKHMEIDCPECGQELVLRQGRYGMFIGCSNYPQCHHIETQESSEPNQEVHSDCPECGQGQLVARRGRNGKTFYACNAFPKCKFSVNAKPISRACKACGFGLMIEKKSGEQVYYQCASRKCQHKDEML